MRLQPARVEEAVAFVQQQRPTAQLLNQAPDRLSFSIPQEVCIRPNLLSVQVEHVLLDSCQTNS